MKEMIVIEYVNSINFLKLTIISSYLVSFIYLSSAGALHYSTAYFKYLNRHINQLLLQ